MNKNKAARGSTFLSLSVSMSLPSLLFVNCSWVKPSSPKPS